jgi:hypothetical protein
MELTRPVFEISPEPTASSLQETAEATGQQKEQAAHERSLKDGTVHHA